MTATCCSPTSPPGATSLRADGIPVHEGFSYTSDTNDQWFTAEEINKILENDV